MTKPFEVNLDKVSKAVKQFVADVAKTDGSKKKIDSKREFDKLSEYLCGSGNSMNNDEIGYVQGFMIEYQQKQFDDNVTENLKKEVSKIAKRMGDKKKIDTDEEAQALALMLRNSHNDLNQADLAVIRNLLISSGYANYLEQDKPSVTIVNVQIQEQKENETTDDNVQNKQCVPIEDKNYPAPKPRSKKINKEPHTNDKEVDRAAKEADRSRAEADRSAKEADRSAKEADRSKAEADRAAKEANSIKKAPKVSEKARAEGFGIANKIQEELHDFWTNDGTVEHELNRVNSANAYSFVGKMMAVSDEHNAFGSFYKRVSSSSVCHAVFSLLNQAKKLGLEKDEAYQTLLETYKFLRRQYQDKRPNDPISDELDIQKLDIEVKHLYNVMSKVYK